ncbi:ROK family protein [Paenibacillus amylolyticus]|nr:ROK family protein [Paenibacillus amylolyticus]
MHRVWYTRRSAAWIQGVSIVLWTLLGGLEEAFSSRIVVRAFPCEVILENDVNLAALGEYRRCSSRVSLVCFFLDWYRDGCWHHGTWPTASRFRWLNWRDRRDAGGRWSTSEEVLSADGLMQLAKDYLDQHGELLLEAADSGADVNIDVDVVANDLHRQLTPEELFEAARSGEVEALEILKQYSQKIASALRQISVVLAPDLIVLGGGVGGNGDVLLPLLRQIISEQFPVQPQLICSKLGEQAVVTGAVQVAIQQTMLNLQQEAME